MAAFFLLATPPTEAYDSRRLRGGNRMKKMLVMFVVFGLLWCASAQDNKMNDSKVKETLLAQEKALWDAWAKKDTKAFDEWVAPNAMAIDMMGIWDKAATLKAVGSHNCTINSTKFSDEKLTWIDKNVAMLTFTAWQDGMCDGQKIPAKVFVSSTWKKAKGKWWAIAHAESAEVPAPPAK
jgi:hypothetical protein